MSNKSSIPARVVVAPLPRHIPEGPRASINEVGPETLKEKLNCSLKHLSDIETEIGLIYDSLFGPRPAENNPPLCAESIVDCASSLANRLLIVANDLGYIRSRLG